MILLDPVVKVFAASDANRCQNAPRPIPQPVLGITGNDRFPIGLATVDDDAIWAAVAGQSLAHEALCRRKVTVFAEEEFDGVANTFDGPVEVHPLPANLDVGLVHVPLAANASLSSVNAFSSTGEK